MNEYLLKQSAQHPNNFFRSHIGGITIMENLPAYTTCQCNNNPVDTDVVDNVNTLVADACVGTRTPIYPSYCNESRIFQSLLSANSSLFNRLADAELQIPNNLHQNCIDASLNLVRKGECILGVSCFDETCKQCDCANQTHSSWYGDLYSNSNSSIIVWFNNEVDIMLLQSI